MLYFKIEPPPNATVIVEALQQPKQVYGSKNLPDSFLHMHFESACSFYHFFLLLSETRGL